MSTAVTRPLPASRYIAFVSIASLAITPTNPRGIALPGWEKGVFDFNDLVDQTLLPLFKAGFRRFMLWNPWGGNPTTSWKIVQNGFSVTLQVGSTIDDYLLLKSQDYPPYRLMVSTFEQAITRFQKATNNADIIVYCGTALGNPRFNGLNPSQIVARLNASLEPYFNTGCHMALDASSGIPPSHWLPQYYPTIEAAGLRVYVEAAPWNYPYLRTRGFISALEQLRNVTPASIRPQTPTQANGGFIGFADPAKITGERLGGLFGKPPAKYVSWLDWYKKIIPRAFNSGQIDSIVLAMNPFMGLPYAPNPPLTLAQLVSQLEITTDKNYGAFI
jgi:hypothetical protein